MIYRFLFHLSHKILNYRNTSILASVSEAFCKCNFEQYITHQYVSYTGTKKSRKTTQNICNPIMRQ